MVSSSSLPTASGTNMSEPWQDPESEHDEFKGFCFIELDKLRADAEADSYKGDIRWELLDESPELYEDAMRSTKRLIEEELPVLESLAIKINGGKPMKLGDHVLSMEEKAKVAMDIIPALYNAYVMRAMHQRAEVIRELTKTP